jgi:hypothetical protein
VASVGEGIIGCWRWLREKIFLPVVYGQAWQVNAAEETTPMPGKMTWLKASEVEVHIDVRCKNGFS